MAPKARGIPREMSISNPVPAIRPRTWQRILLLLALLVGVALRTSGVNEIPPGLYRDEAYTGMDGLATLDEGPRLFYPIAFGREPLFTWLVAGSIGLWGPTPFAIRFPSMVSGLLTLVALYLAARELWGTRIATLSVAVLSVTLWHVLISRVGFRAVLVPLVSALGVWQVARGVRTGRQRHWICGGLAAGALLYTYMPARFAALPAMLMLAVAWRRSGRSGLPSWRHLAAFAMAAAAVMTPFAVYAVAHPDEVLLRTATVASVFNSDTPWVMLWDNVKGAAGMFLVRGDYLSRHNLPLRPVFDPALGIVALLGAGIVLRRSRRDVAAAFLVLWTACLLLPMVLAEKAPHFLRGIGVLPFLAVFPAIGLDWLWGILRRRSHALATAAVALPLLVGFASTTRAYFRRYPQVDDLCFRFECAGTQLASEVNGLLGQGWTRGARSAAPGPARTDAQVVVQHQLWKDVVNAHYLIPDTEAFSVPGSGSIVSSVPAPDLPLVYYGWHNRHYPDYWREELSAWLPPQARIELVEGPLAITAQDKTPHPAYLRFTAVPADLADERIADLAHDLSLVASCIGNTGPDVIVRLVWYAGTVPPPNHSVFLHFERNGEVIAQADGEPGLGYYPMTTWRPGDQFVDERTLPNVALQPGDALYVGLYNYLTGDRVPVLAATTESSGNRVRLAVSNCTPGTEINP